MTRKVFICGQFWHPYARMFMNYNREKGEKVYEGVRSIKDADIVVFTGGPDVNPELYGEKRIEGTYTNDIRDRDDQSYFAQAEGKFLIGICRGAQFLCVKAGGKLWQDVNNHDQGHFIMDVKHGAPWDEIWASSTHHQQMRVPPRCRGDHRRGRRVYPPQGGRSRVAPDREGKDRLRPRSRVVPQDSGPRFSAPPGV